MSSPTRKPRTFRIVRDAGTFTDYRFHDRVIGEKVVFVSENHAYDWIRKNAEDHDPTDLFVMPGWIVELAKKRGWDDAIMG